MKHLLCVLLTCLVAFMQFAWSYPIDGYSLTGIRRLNRLQQILDGKSRGTAPVKGACRSIQDIKLNLQGERGESLAVLPVPDPELQREIDTLFPDRHESYCLALLDITPGRKVRYAGRQEDRQLSPGSVGKLVILAGLFKELKRLYPSPEIRHALLKNRTVIADKWILTDEHEVPIFDIESGKYANRIIREGDVFSLYEWVDHMISASNNSAASTVWKEVLLMRAFGSGYPPSLQQEKDYFDKTPKTELRDQAMTINDPLRDAGISARDWQLGSFFTRTGKQIVPGGGGSVATPKGYLQYLVAVERGLMVDSWSSLEIKRLMYMTARRIRYASAPRLNEAAVYFKSGSLYRCKAEPNFKCGKYMGNVENVMNSVAIVEHPDGRVYLVGLMSNVLKKNSAVEHQTLATYVDRILEKQPTQ